MKTRMFALLLMGLSTGAPGLAAPPSFGVADEVSATADELAADFTELAATASELDEDEYLADTLTIDGRVYNVEALAGPEGLYVELSEDGALALTLNVTADGGVVWTQLRGATVTMGADLGEDELVACIICDWIRCWLHPDTCAPKAPDPEERVFTKGNDPIVVTEIGSDYERIATPSAEDAAPAEDPRILDTKGPAVDDSPPGVVPIIAAGAFIILMLVSKLAK